MPSGPDRVMSARISGAVAAVHHSGDGSRGVGSWRRTVAIPAGTTVADGRPSSAASACSAASVTTAVREVLACRPGARIDRRDHHICSHFGVDDPPERWAVVQAAGFQAGIELVLAQYCRRRQLGTSACGGSTAASTMRPVQWTVRCPVSSACEAMASLMVLGSTVTEMLGTPWSSIDQRVQESDGFDTEAAM